MIHPQICWFTAIQDRFHTRDLKHVDQICEQLSFDIQELGINGWFWRAKK